jgi:hypothetical protein
MGFSMSIYLAEYADPITQASYNAIGYYALSSVVSPVNTYPQPMKENVKTYPTVSFAGVTPTRTLKCVGLYSYSATCTAVAVDPPITHDSSTTIYVHYILKVYLDDNDSTFGYETLVRSATAVSSWFSTGGQGIDWGPHHVGLPGYKKHFYISLLARKKVEAADTPATSYLFRYADDDLYGAKKGYITIPQWWTGPIGGVYEMRNSGLCAAGMYDPHVSRVFAHIASQSSKLFYDSSEFDVPESEGTLTIDESGTTAQLPFVYQINFRDTGDVGTSTYNLRQWICPSGNERYPGATFDCHSHVSGFNWSHFHKKQIYISGNRDWRSSKDSMWASYWNYSGTYIVNPYTFCGYKNLERCFFTETDQYCIRNDGILYYTKAGTSTSINTISIGSKTFITQAGLPFVAGNMCRIIYAYGVGNYMEGTVTSYSGTTLVVNITAIWGTGNSVNTWVINRCSTIVRSVDLNSNNIYPPEITEFDLATELPTAGIKAILGMCIDEDDGCLWVATNVGFVRCYILTEISGGAHVLPYVTPYDFELFDHNTPNFGLYMADINGCIIYDPWNGRFTAERGTLTWTQLNSPRTVWHWTGDREARSILVTTYGVFNLFVEYDLGYIAVVRNSNYNTTAYQGTCYVTIIRIGDAIEGLVSTYVYDTQINTGGSAYGGYGTGLAQQKFWVVCGDYSPTGSGKKMFLDLITFTWTTLIASNYAPTEYTAQSTYVYNSNIFQACSANRSMHPHVITYPVNTDFYNSTFKLAIDSGPVYWGWDGSEWVVGDTNVDHTKHTHFSLDECPDNVLIGFNDGGISNSFRAGEYYSLGVNPKGLYIDNLQTATIYCSMYGWHSNVVTRTIIVPGGDIYTIPETADPHFKYMAAWYRDPHAKVIFLDLSGDPVGSIVNSVPASTLKVQYTYDGTVVFYPGHAGESVEIRYVWLTGVVE